MKNSKKKMLALGVIIFLGSILYVGKSTKFQTINLDKKSIKKQKENFSQEKRINFYDSPRLEKLSSFKSFSLDEKKSLVILTSFFNDAARSDLPMTLFVEDLKDLKLRPVVMKDHNEYTGGLNIIRTKNTLPGTRYIHAQYFEGEDSTSLLQHLSFEFKGGEKSFDLVKKVIQEQLKIVSDPIQQSSTFVSWRVGKKIVWIKKLDLKDISKDNPFNSYDLKNDIGTIRVTIELEIH